KAYRILELASAASKEDDKDLEIQKAELAVKTAKEALQKAEEAPARAKGIEMPKSASDEKAKKEDQGQEDENGGKVTAVAPTKKGEEATLNKALADELTKALTNSFDPKFKALGQLF